jgi:hypothetical protein
VGRRIKHNVLGATQTQPPEKVQPLRVQQQLDAAVGKERAVALQLGRLRVSAATCERGGDRKTNGTHSEQNATSISSRLK